MSDEIPPPAETASGYRASTARIPWIWILGGLTVAAFAARIVLFRTGRLYGDDQAQLATLVVAALLAATVAAAAARWIRSESLATTWRSQPQCLGSQLPPSPWCNSLHQIRLTRLPQVRVAGLQSPARVSRSDYG